MIWLIGDQGMLGQELAGVLLNAGVEYTGSDREVDITDPIAVESFIADNRSDVIINCAAYTAVDRAEDDLEAAERLNVQGPENLARGALNSGVRLIHISTDYVFTGDQDRPLKEDEPTEPIGVYGRTKRDGETAILESGCRYDIVRTAWLYGLLGPNFVATMISLMKEQDELRVVSDQIGSPTWAFDLAQLLAFLAGRPDRRSDIFHFSNEGRISWYDFACAIQEEAASRGLVNRNVSITPCGSEEYPTPARRPAFSLLSKQKIKEQFDWHVPEWRDSLCRYLDLIGEKE